MPPCPVFGHCGGCSWQHVKYPEQLKQKENIVEWSLKKLREEIEFEILPIVASPSEFHYRNRIQINKKAGKAGFFARGSRDIVPISDCPISEKEISERIPSLDTLPDGRYEISRRADGLIETAYLQRDPETALFSQVNSGQNENLIKTLIAWSSGMQAAAIWDLYCGSGNLTFPWLKPFPMFPSTGLNSVVTPYEARKKRPAGSNGTRSTHADSSNLGKPVRFASCSRSPETRRGSGGDERHRPRAAGMDHLRQLQSYDICPRRP